MRIVVSDTGPIQYLILCDAIDLLPKLFGEVIIPEGVVAELSHENTPRTVKAWLATPPDWMSIRKASSSGRVLGLGRGETEAIELALTFPGVFLLVDDEEARDVALRMGIPITGTVGILGRGVQAGLLNVAETVQKLRNTTFYLS